MKKRFIQIHTAYTMEDALEEIKQELKGILEPGNWGGVKEVYITFEVESKE